MEAAFRSVVKKVHPDKGGAVADAQRLQQARKEWQDAKSKASAGGGRPAKAAVVATVAKEGQQRTLYRIRSTAALLTYHGIAEDAWQAFLAFVSSHLTEWGVANKLSELSRVTVTRTPYCCASDSNKETRARLANKIKDAAILSRELAMKNLRSSFFNWRIGFPP